MCGIAGRILNAPGRVGNDLVELMDAQEHRGADSTGFAIYGAPREGDRPLILDDNMPDVRIVERKNGLRILGTGEENRITGAP